jgi:hypothetical protein
LVKIQVFDDVKDTPIEGAEVNVSFDQGNIGGIIQDGRTNEKGKFSCSGTALPCIWFSVESDGYYGYGIWPAEKDYLCGKNVPDSIAKRINLRPVINPIGLYARKNNSEWHESESKTEIPAFDVWCGYDFKIGDWVAPYGRGESEDVLFRLERAFLGYKEGPSLSPLEKRRDLIREKYERIGEKFTEEIFKMAEGKWNFQLRISFPREKEGISEVVEGYSLHNVLRMPHEAPDVGYKPELQYELNNYERSDGSERGRREEVGYFLRTRVVLDISGEIVSANYAKIYGDIEFLLDGRLSFLYYFNAEANNRNLEFNPDMNLFPEDTPGIEQVILP